MGKKNVFTISNILNLFKVIFIALFFVFYLTPTFYLDGGYPIFAILIYFLIGAIDIFINFNSKSYTTKNNFEKILDPVMNRVFRNSILIAFTINGAMPLYATIILGTIDLVSLILGGYLLTKKIVFHANLFGKITAYVMYFSLFSCFFSIAIFPWNIVAVLTSTAMVLVTLIIYIVKFFKLYNSTQIEK